MYVARFFGSKPGQLTVFAALLLVWQVWASSSTDGLIPPVTDIAEALWKQLSFGPAQRPSPSETP